MGDPKGPKTWTKSLRESQRRNTRVNFTEFLLRFSGKKIYRLNSKALLPKGQYGNIWKWKIWRFQRSLNNTPKIRTIEQNMNNERYYYKISTVLLRYYNVQSMWEYVCMWVITRVSAGCRLSQDSQPNLRRPKQEETEWQNSISRNREYDTSSCHLPPQGISPRTIQQKCPNSWCYIGRNDEVRRLY